MKNRICLIGGNELNAYYYENGEMTCIQSCSGEYKYYSKETMMCYKECPRGKETNSNDERKEWFDRASTTSCFWYVFICFD